MPLSTAATLALACFTAVTVVKATAGTETVHALVGAAAAVPAGTVRVADAGHARGKTSPNIFMILADDFGHYNIGWRNPEIRSPKIDALAADGLKLNRHVTTRLCGSTAPCGTVRARVHVASCDGVIVCWCAASSKSGAYQRASGKHGCVPRQQIELRHTELPRRRRRLSLSLSLSLSLCLSPSLSRAHTHTPSLSLFLYHHTHMQALRVQVLLTDPVLHDVWPPPTARHSLPLHHRSSFSKWCRIS